MKSVGIGMLVLLLGLVTVGCESKLKQPALGAISIASSDIADAKIDSDVVKKKMSLSSAESLLAEAEAAFTKKDYVNAKSSAEKASSEAKSIVLKAKEKKISGKKATEKKLPVQPKKGS
jgi:Tfp pilus assembly protein PilX